MINNQLLTDADDICNAKLDITTRRRYNRFFDQFKEWVVQNHDEIVDQAGDLLLRNITDEAFKEFLAQKTKKTYKDDTYTGKLIIGKLSEFIGILTANCCTAILRPFQRCFWS